MLAWNGYGSTGGNGPFSERVWDQILAIGLTPVFIIITFCLAAILVRAADIRSKTRRYVVGIIHSIFHLATLLIGTALVSMSVAGIQTSVPYAGDILHFLAVAVGMLVLGFVGGFFWGLYLTIVSYFWGDEGNNAFSALGLDTYKNFIRLKIEGDNLTVYPIGIDKVPSRDGWQFNEDNEDGNQDTPTIAPKVPIECHLVEKTITMDIKTVATINSLE